MEFFIIITIMLTVGLILADLFHYLKSSKMIGLMVAGIIMSLPFIKDNYYTPEISVFIKFMADLGMIFLLFISGLEINSKKLRKCGKDEILISFFAYITPFVVTLIVMLVLGSSFLLSLITGIALSITSTGAIAMVLMEYKKIKSKIGTILIGSGILDDLIGIISLFLVILFFNGGGYNEFFLFILKIICFALIITLSFRSFLPRLTKHNLSRTQLLHDSGNVLSIVIILGFVIASLAILFGVGQVIGGFIAGFIIQKIIKNKKETEFIVQEIKDFSFALIIPFFFIYIGINFDLGSVLNDLFLFFILLFVAMFGKLFGTIMIKPFSGLKLKQLSLIGFGMNSRGMVELVILEVARNANIISLGIYSHLVLIAILTTFIFPFIIRFYLFKWPKIMD